MYYWSIVHFNRGPIFHQTKSETALYLIHDSPHFLLPPFPPPSPSFRFPFSPSNDLQGEKTVWDSHIESVDQVNMHKTWNCPTDVFQHYLIIAVVCLFLPPLHLVPRQSLGHHWWPAGAPNLQQVLIDALVALDALLRGVSHQLSLHHCTGSSRSSGLNSAERDLLAQLLPPLSKHPPRSGEELRSQFVTQEIKMLSPKRGQSQGYCWSLGHISQHHRWSSAGPMCKHYQPKSKESVVNLWQYT